MVHAYLIRYPCSTGGVTRVSSAVMRYLRRKDIVTVRSETRSPEKEWRGWAVGDTFRGIHCTGESRKPSFPFISYIHAYHGYFLFHLYLARGYTISCATLLSARREVSWISAGHRNHNVPYTP